MSDGKKETHAKITLTWTGMACTVEIDPESHLTARMVERANGIILRELRKRNMAIVMEKRKRERAAAKGIPEHDKVNPLSTAKEVEEDIDAAEKETEDFTDAMDRLDAMLDKTGSDNE